MTIIKTTKELQKRREHDFYPTPEELCTAVFNYHKIYFQWEGVKVLDVGAGDGVWGKALRKINPSAVITGVEIRDLPKPDEYDFWYVGDFNEIELHGFDVVVGNPPFMYVEEFVRKGLASLHDYGVLIYLLRLSFLESQKRGNGLYKEFPLYEMSVSTRRISFTGDKKSDNTAYGIYCWLKNFKGVTKLSWLDWSYEWQKEQLA